MGLLTSTVGSFPKPAELRRARRQFADEEIEAPALREVEERAVRAVLALQEEIGIDLLVDGEMDRGDMTTFFAERLEGMEVSGLVRSYGNRYYRKPVIVGEVRRTAPMTVERWRFAQGATTKPVKAILTGPYTLMDWSFDEHYPSREACCMALAESVRAADKSVELVRTLYLTGLTDFENVLIMQRSLFDQQDQLADSTGRISKNLIRLYKALGGGWKVRAERQQANLQ